MRFVDEKPERDSLVEQEHHELSSQDIALDVDGNPNQPSPECRLSVPFATAGSTTSHSLQTNPYVAQDGPGGISTHTWLENNLTDHSSPWSASLNAPEPICVYGSAQDPVQDSPQSEENHLSGSRPAQSHSVVHDYHVPSPLPAVPSPSLNAWNESEALLFRHFLQNLSSWVCVYLLSRQVHGLDF